ncbi:MAG TPA: DUF2652 domain-containing protein [Anaerolineales bacterium]|nr:DUF2652 domain-containing protein [Anaerolineales bacterium]
MAKTENGYFLIADITGYTQYLSVSELEHAHEVLQTLMELLIEHTRPPLIISRLAGDAVISYGLQDNFLSGQTFLEMIEDTYVAFRRAINLMVLNTSCDCKACANISTLDLKFFVHYGSFTRQRLDQHDELLGADVIVAHRLLKNHVTEATGCRAYALYTDAAIRQLGIEDVCAAMTEHNEEYEHLGEVKTWVQDMHPVWQEKQNALKLEIPANQILFQLEEEYPLPVEAMWNLLTLPEYRSLIVHSVRQNILNRQNGRVGPGSQFQCFHGDGRVTMQTILEWHPFEQMTTEDITPVPRVTVLLNFRVEPTANGTRLMVTCSKGRGPLLNRIICDLGARFLVPASFKQGLNDLRVRLEKELAEGKHEIPQSVPVSAEQIKQAAAASLSDV